MSALFPANSDFLPQFKAIGQSLKKRFFRKPNVSDAVEQYELLCQELQREDQKEFAGLCALEAAKCQESLQNYIPQANLLLKAATLFMDAKKSRTVFENGMNSSQDRVGGLSSGYFQFAIQSLNQAAKIFKAQNSFGLSLVTSMKAGEALYLEGDYGEALINFKLALDIATSHFTLADQVVVVEEIVKCKVKMTELEGASKLVSEFLNRLKREMTNDFGKELLQPVFLRFEIMRVCLTLLVGSADMIRFIWPESSSTPERISASEGSENTERYQVHIYLKSLVLAVQHGSVDEINAVSDHLAPILKETQNDLFRALIQMQL